MATYPGILSYGGDIVSADDVNANIATIYTKDNSENRISTTTLSDDGELKNIPLGVGVYEVELVMFHSAAYTGGTSGTIKTTWAFSGTWNNPVRACQGGGQTNTSPTNRATELYTFGVNAGSNAQYGTDATAGNYSVAREISRQVVVTASGNLSLQWAQPVSTASNTTVLGGTSISVRQISA